jgi:uncharacterized protein (TIGR03083 family)
MSSDSTELTVSDEVMALAEQLGDLRDLVDDLTDEDFGRPTRCPDWSVAELVAHCEGMLFSLVSENAEPMDGAPEIDRFAVYGYDPNRRYPFPDTLGGGKADRTNSEVVRDRVIKQARGRRPGQLRTSFHFAVDGVLSRLLQIPADRVVRRPPRHPRMTFGELVASRHVEFGIHTMDIAQAVGRPELIRPAAAAIITGILDDLLGQTVPESLGWDSTRYILSGTGRRQLTPTEREMLGPLALRFPLLR